jgi:hypothetical protein
VKRIIVQCDDLEPGFTKYIIIALPQQKLKETYKRSLHLSEKAKHIITLEIELKYTVMEGLVIKRTQLFYSYILHEYSRALGVLTDSEGHVVRAQYEFFLEINYCTKVTV